jgi:cyclophilin family peptidyl-prolyl cis-trans isomerase
LEGLEDRKVPAVLTVTTTADSGAGSLRQAILDADDTTTNPGQNTIDFNIATSGPQLINLASPLPFLANASGIIIDGTTEPGYSGTPLIVINGSGSGSVDGLVVIGGNSTIKGLAIQNFSLGAGIILESSGNTVAGDVLGANAAGTSAAGNNFGVEITGSASNNTIGGTTAAARNLISGNGTYGVLIAGTGATGNTVEGNNIGANQAGSGALANGFDGVALIDTAGNTLGGTTGGAANVIAGNSRFGVYLWGASTKNNVVEGNFIGTDSTGVSAVANGADGVILLGGAADNVIGGTSSSAANVISGNGRFGILLSDSGTSSNTIEGNLIGVNKTATAALANANDGVAILNSASNNTIGGTTSGAGNVIGGNREHGVLIGVAGTTGNLVEGNFIGTNTAGTLALANGYAGVMVLNGASSNTIGGSASGAGNTIAFNGYAGVVIGASPTDTTAGDLVSGNNIYSNVGGIAVDLGNNGTSQNNLLGSTGPNHFQIFPVPVGASLSGTAVTVRFAFIASVANSTFRLEFFLNNSGDSPEGRFFLGSATVMTDATGTVMSVTGGSMVSSGEGEITLTAPSGVTPSVGQTLTATAILQTTTATGTTGDTSEYSPPVTLSSAFMFQPPTVTNPIPPVNVAQNAATVTIDLAGHFGDPDIVDGNTTVTMHTSSGDINLTLFDQSAPQTVANFVDYAVNHLYDNSFFHRLANLSTTAPVSPTNPAQIIQGGGFTVSPTGPAILSTITAGPMIANEYNSTNPNAANTIAMARTTALDSATDEWFFNLTDNSAALPNYAVFGRLSETAVSGATLNALAQVPTFDQSGSNAPAAIKGALTNLPLSAYTGTNNDPNFPANATAGNFEVINSVSVTQKDALTYSITNNTNASLVTPSFVPNHPEQLQLTFATGQTGSAIITVQATNKNGQSITTNITVTVT